MVRLPAVHQALGAVIGPIDDVSATRRIQLIVAVLATAGLLLVVLTVWFWRVTRPTPDVLGPLDAMSRRRFWRSDPNTRRRVLDEARPDGAAAIPETKPPPVDLAALAAARPLPSFDDHGGFGDLVEASVAGERADDRRPFGPPNGADPVRPLGNALPVSPVTLFDRADHTDAAIRFPSFDSVPSVEPGAVPAVELPDNPKELAFRPFGLSSSASRTSFPPPSADGLVDTSMEPIDVPDPE